MAQANTQASARPNRPTSPHLQVYSPLINMVMSIVHRITGAALYFGTLLLAIWLVAAATGPEAYAWVNGLIAGTLIGKLILFGYTWALMHHMMGGLRHFIWDTGNGFALSTVDALSWATLICSLVLTAGIWAYVLKLQGAF
jgi:succinate dehydrogenase / fumarate reductase cytochrome b subunit